MENSTKMTLVPTTEAELHQLSEYDSELTNILKNKELNQVLLHLFYLSSFS